jgi:hypothetical protein
MFDLIFFASFDVLKGEKKAQINSFFLAVCRVLNV